MAPYCGFELLFLPVERGVGRLRKLCLYVLNGWKTLQVLLLKRPQVVWIQLPQVPLLWVALIYSKLSGSKVMIIADCHNKMFRTPWSRFPLGIRLLSRCGLVLVHNNDVYRDAIALGINPGVVKVVEDPPAFFDTTAATPARTLPHPLMVFPASFAEDEPIAELLQAAALVPEVSFAITGNLRNCKDQTILAHAPANVSFVGFLDRDDFDRLLLDSDAVIALTRFDGIQLSVCGEAVGAGKPMLISDTATLRSMFPAGSIFVRSDDPSAIASGIKDLLVRLGELEAAAQVQQQHLTAQWREQKGSMLMELVAAA